MNELDTVNRLGERILSRLPQEMRSAVEIEITQVKREVGLRANVLSCTACSLAETCTNKVPGVGPTDASIMLVGEAPGENENDIGVPFVGRGGEMLKSAIHAIGWKWDDLYITNTVKCHPPKNRNVTQAEVAACYQHLKDEIAVVRPKVIIALGSLAASTLIHPDFKITQENGNWFELSEGTRGMAVYHPSYLLRLGDNTARQNQAKWEVYNALKKVQGYQEGGFSPSSNRREMWKELGLLTEAEAAADQGGFTK